MTTPQEEAERRWPGGYKHPADNEYVARNRAIFVSGAEWLASEIGLTVEQIQRLGPLVEAARVWAGRRYEWLHCDSDAEYDQMESSYERASEALLAAAAALDGGTEV